MSHREEALRLRGMGLSYRKIGLILQLSAEGVRQMVKPTKRIKVKPMLDEKLMLNMSEAAKVIGVHTNTLRRWANKGVVRCYRISTRGDRRFKREDIDRFLAGNITQKEVLR